MNSRMTAQRTLLLNASPRELVQEEMAMGIALFLV